MRPRRRYLGLWYDPTLSRLSGLFLFNVLFRGCHNFTRHPARYASRGQS